MRVPSYDDLTPSIPDVHPRDTFDQLTRLVPAEQPVVSVVPRFLHPGEDPIAPLFACLRASTADAAELVALAHDFSPRIERHGDGCVVLDVSGLGRLLGDAAGIAAELTRSAAERGIKLQVAIAPTQVATLLLTLHAPVNVATRDIASALAAVSLESLDALDRTLHPTRACRTPGIVEILTRWGLRTVGEYAALPPDEVSARFGRDGAALQRLARGIDSRPLVPDPGVPRFMQSMELEWPIEELEPLSFVFARLLDPLSVTLERADRAGAAIRLDLRLVDKTMHSRMLQLPAPIRDPRVLRTLLLLDLESHPPSAGIDVVTIEIDPAPSRIVQYSLLERATPSPETLATLTARLNALIGESRCGSPVLLDSHRPDAFEMQPFSPEDRPAFGRVTEQYQLPTPPERFAQRRNSQLPSTLILRRYRSPIAMRVQVECGRPAHVANLRKGIPNGRVVQAAGPWRSSGCWWTASGTHWDRDEWDVELTDGSICRIYCDRATNRWFLDAVID